MEKQKSKMIHDSYQTATGPIPYNMTNDYMFRVILQKNEFVLRGMIGSLLHLDQSEIKSVQITNPIELGELIDNKTFILDIHVTMNDDTDLNLEMQMVNYSNWTERSLSYLCRMYDHLYRGQDYVEARRAIHIGILDFTLFEDVPEFYACYKMINTKNQHVFSDKFILHVLNLREVELATDDDRAYQIDQWAKLFKATTWEEMRMLTESNKYMSEAAAEMYKLNADDIVRQQCRAREEYYRHEEWVRRKFAEQEKQLEEKDKLIAELREQVAQLQEKQ